MLGLKFVEKTAVEKELVKEKKQKQKKEKKAKKKKEKLKKAERKEAVSSDASLSDDGDKSPVQEEVAAEEPPAAAPREDWMAMDFSTMGAPKEEPKKPAGGDPGSEYAPGLNVVTASGGLAGLPPSSSGAPVGVGDGGSSWRLKALKRAQEQARQEGADLAEVVRERWGSVAELVEAASSKATAAGRPGSQNRGRGSRQSMPHYLQEVGSSRTQMRMPKVDDSLSWRSDRRRDRRDDNGPDGRTYSGRETSTSGREKNGHRYDRGEKEDARGRDDWSNRGGGTRSSRDERMQSTKEREGAERPGRDTTYERDERDETDWDRDKRDERDRGADRDKRDERDRGIDRDKRDERDLGIDRDKRDERGRRIDRDKSDERDRGIDRDKRDERDLGIDRDKRHERSAREERGQADQKDSRANDRRGREHDERAAHSAAARKEGAKDKRDWRDGGSKAQQRTNGSRSGDADEMNEERQELLKSAAAAINEMPNDGSFMERFKALERKNQELKAAATQQARQDKDKPASGEDEDMSGGEDANKAFGSTQPAHPRAAAEPVNNHSVAALLRARLKQGVKTQSVDELAAPGSSARPPSSSRPTASAKSDRPKGSAGDAAAALRNKLMAGKKGAAGAKPEPQPRAASSDDEGSVEVLPQVDQDGRAVYGAFGRELAVNKPGDRGKNKVQRYGEDGKRERYFKDDDDVDLDTLVKRAKYGDDEIAGVDEAMARSIMTSKRFKEAELDADAEYDLDAGLDRSEDRRKHGTREQQMQRERARQISEHRKIQSLEDGCKFCFKSKQRPKHLTIAIAQTVYLSLIERGMLAAGHCYIAPLEHIASTRKVDDHSWTEIRNFQKCLIRMFMEQGKETIFMETAIGLNTYRHHGVMECIPVDKDVMAKAPLYFKKGIDEAESEWSQHHAKRLIQTREKGLRGCIPPNFPYFYVQFGYSEGYVHVIDDESKWNPDFGRQILVGLMKLPAEEMHRRQRADSINAQQHRAAEFGKQWDPFDWTKQLEG